MAKIVIQALCTLEGDIEFVIHHLTEALEEMKTVASDFGVGEAHVISISGMDCEELLLTELK